VPEPDGDARPLRVALLSYRSDPRCGGQGVYLRHLSRELVAAGHAVTVFSGPPYPEAVPGVRLERVPSLELYEPPGPFATRAWRNIRTRTDVHEFWEMLCGRFPEPITFSARVHRRLRYRPGAFDVVHDNQSLGWGIAALADDGLPVVGTIHHPLTVDVAAALDYLTDERARRALLRWYRFIDVQKQVAPRLTRLLTVSEASRRDIETQMGVPPGRLHVVPNGVDVSVWRPRPGRVPVPGRILTTSSSDNLLKGLVHLLEAVAKLRTERSVELVVVGRPPTGGRVAEAIERLGVGDAVTFRHDLGDEEFVDLYATAEVAVVPSIYEGFSLPAVEAMACGVPLVATTGGAIPEVVGRDGEAALTVPPADAGALAVAIGRLLDDPVLGARLAAAGRARVEARFTWTRAAERTVAHYRAARSAVAAGPPTAR
jgi:glycosyltransferase involved in cell wall biosynthesis